MTVVNEAGDYLTSMHQWKWLERPPVLGKVRAEIVVADGTWTAATRQLTSTGAFSTYDHVPGDTVTVTAGTGASQLRSIVESKVDSDNIRLKTSIASGNLATGDIAATLDNWSVELPSDFQTLVGYDATESLVNSLTLTTLEHLLQLRTNQIEVSTWNFWGCISYASGHLAGQADDDDGYPTPILQIWPKPSANDFDALTFFYRAGWTKISDDNAELHIPEWVEMLYLQILREVALGYKEFDNATLSERLAIVAAGPIFATCVKRDGETQPDYGVIKGGMVLSQPTSVRRFLRQTVAGPS